MEQTIVLPEGIRQGLDQFLQDARLAFGEALVTAVLFGSAAEGRLRPTSDVNLLLVLRHFDRKEADLLRDPFRAAHASMRLDVMFLLESEITQAMDAFAVKFSDILSRRYILFGPDPFSGLSVPRAAVLRRTRQVLMNLILRMRERYTLVSLREEQLTGVIADMTGPLRASAASLLRLEGRPAASPREALAAILSESGNPEAPKILDLIDTARREGTLPPEAAGMLLFSLLKIAEDLYTRTEKLPDHLEVKTRV
ncbi:MAG: hypothetical protein C0402_01860 [Thermodesulfovibrio sp.]|nr:hypothetical protein [Thermodesulfovibrio sp.]